MEIFNRWHTVQWRHGFGSYIQAASTFRALTMVGSESGGATTGEIVIQIVGETISAESYNATQVAFQYSEGGQIIISESAGAGWLF